MEQERTIVLENTGICSVALKDTQSRIYRLPKDGKVRISKASLQDILDYPGSKAIFELGYVVVRNISSNELYLMGLTDAEIEKYLVEETPVVVITEEIKEEPVAEEVIVVKAPVIEEAAEEVEETPVVEKPIIVKPQTTNEEITLNTLGFTCEVASDKDRDLIRKATDFRLTNHRVFKISNKETEAAFNPKGLKTKLLYPYS